MKYDETLDCKFLHYIETRSKNHQGGTKDLGSKLKMVSAYANKGNPSHCMVNLYEKYLSKCLSHDPKCSHHLYLHLLKRYTEHIWYSCQPLGIKMLQHVTEKLAACANIPGKRSNHSLCAVGPTQMYSTGMDDKLVRELTRHRLNAVLEYKHTPVQLKHHVSEVLYGNQDTHVPVKKHGSSQEVESGEHKTLANCSQDGITKQVGVPCVQMSQGSMNVTVNYNIPKSENMPVINVYPIINVP